MTIIHRSNIMYKVHHIYPSFTAQWLLYVPPALTFNISAFSPQSVFIRFAWLSQYTAVIPLNSINR
jgi:hypothetical protein